MAQSITIPHNLVNAVNRYYREHVAPLKDEKAREWELVLLNKGLDIFLKFLTQDFKDRFYAQLEKEIVAYKDSFKAFEKNYDDPEKMQSEVAAFSDRMASQDSLKIFIGKDAYLLYKDYASKYKHKQDYVFLPYSRKYLFDISNGNGYFQIVNIIYDGAMKTDNIDDFIVYFKKKFREDEQLYLNVKLRTLKMLLKRRIYRRLKDYKSICIIDSGTQGGLIFPFMTVLDDEGCNDTFMLFSCFNWIYPLLKKFVFSKDLFMFHRIEHAGAKLYAKTK